MKNSKTNETDSIKINKKIEQGITGDVLIHLDHESLRDLSVLTVGQRMDLLKNIYQLKIHHRVPVNEWDYIPPSR
jgi:hypothetical protein